MTEADTCRKFVVPLLPTAGWDNDPHSNAVSIVDTDCQATIPMTNSPHLFRLKKP